MKALPILSALLVTLMLPSGCAVESSGGDIHGAANALDTSSPTTQSLPIADGHPAATERELDAHRGPEPQIGDTIQSPQAHSILDHGPIDFTLSGLSQEVDIELPDGATSISLVLIGAPGIHYSIDQLSLNDGPALVPAGWYARENASVCRNECFMRVSFSEQSYAITLPNAPELAYAAGRLRMRFIALDFLGVADLSGSAQLLVIVKHEDPPVNRGELDLHLHFTGAGDLVAANAFVTPWFALAIDDLEAKLNAGGIQLGVITVSDLAPQFKVIETGSGPGNDLGALFSQSGTHGGLGLHVFLVDELLQEGSGGGFGLVLGIAGGIPGPPLVPGTERSGVAVLANPFHLQLLGGLLGGTLAHEIGHYLGLYHSTESDGTGDNINDTVTGETDNLMYWTETGEGNRLTPGQGFVIQQSPLIGAP